MADAAVPAWQRAWRPYSVGFSSTLVRVSKAPLGRGRGYLSGSFPAGITSLDGVPTPATIRVLLRGTAEPYLVAEVESAVDGTWRVEGLPPDRRYDVVCRMEGFNDLVLSNVTPAPY